MAKKNNINKSREPRPRPMPNRKTIYIENSEGISREKSRIKFLYEAPADIVEVARLFEASGRV